MSRPTEFILIRHGQSLWNANGRWQGHGDPSLSDKGRRQVADLGRALASEGIQHVISSDLLRAIETASILAEVWGLAPSRDPRFRELDVGVWTGLTRAEIEEREGDALVRFDRREPDLLAGGAESRRQLRLRVRAAAAEIAARHPGERVALVTHLGVVRALVPGTDLDNAQWCRVPAHELATVEQAKV